jgi:hypothetical protein
MNTALVFLSFLLLYLLVIWKGGKTFPILYLFLFTYFLQYIFSTYLIYNEYNVLRSQMPIQQEQFFEYAIPAIFLLFAGVLFFNKDIDLRNSIQRIDPLFAKRLGYLLLFISILIDVLIVFGLTSLQSVAALTSYLKYPAAFCFLFSSSRIKYVIISLIYIQLAVIALQAGVFISFFIWSTYLFFFVSLKFKFSFWLRASFILIAMPLLIIVQSVKKEYREATWVNQRETGIDLLTELAVQKKESSEPFFQSEGVVRTVGRLTQGWHLALTLQHVPKKQPLVNGEEIYTDIISSILPRIFFTDKKTVGSQDKFYKYTGHKLWGSTSMTIGLLGDFYINFGWWGSIIMLFFFGALLAKLLHYFIVRYVLPDPIHIVWIPFMMSYLIRANNDFYMVFNCIVKGFLIFLFVNFISRKFWPKKQVPNLR